VNLGPMLICVVLFLLVASVAVSVWEKREKRKNKELVIAEAILVFGDTDKAIEWLNRKNLVFGKTPISLLNSEAGTEVVRKVLSAIAHGGVV